MTVKKSTIHWGKKKFIRNFFFFFKKERQIFHLRICAEKMKPGAKQRKRLHLIPSRSCSKNANDLIQPSYLEPKTNTTFYPVKNNQTC